MFDITKEPMKTLWRWAETNSGLTAIWARPNAPRPPTPYVELLVAVGPRKLGHDEIRQVSGDIYEAVGQRIFTLQVQVLGCDSMSTAEILHNSLGKPSVQEALRRQGFAVIEEQAILDTSTELETGFEERATLDVLLAYASAVEDDVGFIESVEITNLDTGDLTTVP